VDGLRDHCFHLSLVGDIATDGDRLMAGGNQFLYCGANRVLMEVHQRDGSPRLSEGFGVARPMPEPAPVTSATLSLKDQFTNVSFYRMSSMITFTDTGTFNASTPESILPMTMMPGEGIDCPSCR
jgi:hypothetical protein